ncbi:hypothetical protein [Marinimicrobium alkaliphilum]|uniref:hypothetical protein n=1 Tax=Marinimicrobium alkaliphilum TaxID=2202654 RepID=UPI000DB90AAE|nr:hypothetical protein [Marinimicrobium alkaliphilum]
MYKLTFTGDLVTGFQRKETIENLAELLGIGTDEVQQRFFSDTPVEFKRVESEDEATRWREDFADAGALLIVSPVDEDIPGGSYYAGADPANTVVEEPTIASVTARLPAVRRRNQALMGLGVLAAVLILVGVIFAYLF